MADTAHKTAEEVMEHHDSPDVLADKIDQLAEIIRAANYMVAWTGAGISTSCGIPDFRGPNGVWTLRARGETAVSRTSTISASPSVSHMALKGLIDAGILKKLISSNTDGLHRRSGIHPKHVSELHGNSNRARCNACGASYFVDGRVRCAKGSHDHETPFKCTVRNCSGTLCDTIINFGEYLEEGVPQEANRHGNKADVLLVLGTSLRVITCDAADVITPNGGSLVIVNLQTTPYDDRAALRIFATVDEVMVPLMAKLGLQIPPYGITRRARITYHAKTAEVVFHGCDEAGCPYAFANSASICDADGKVLSTAAVEKAAPFTGIRVPVPVVMAPADDDGNGGDTAAATAATAPQLFLKWTPTSLRGEPPCSVRLPAEGFGQTSWDCLAKMTLNRHDDGDDGSVGAWDAECQPNRATEGKDAAAGKRRPWYFPW